MPNCFLSSLFLPNRSHEPVEDRSFADAVAPVNLRERRVELDRQIAQPLEIEEPDFFDNYRFHLR